MTDRSSSALSRWVLPSPGAVVYGAIFTGAVVWGGLLNGYGDEARHLRVGRIILDTHAIPRVDHLSFTRPGGTVIPSEWLSETLFAAANRFLGLSGVAVLAAFAIALSCWLIYALLIRQGVDPLLALLSSAGTAILTGIQWSARPHVFSFVCAALLLIILERGRRLAPLSCFLLFMVWANQHGGFLFGLVLIVVYLGASMLERDRPGRIAVLLVCAFVGSLINPRGVLLHTNLLATLGNNYLMQNSREFNSPDFHGAMYPFLSALLLIFAVVALSRRQMSYKVLAVVVANVVFSLNSARNIAFFGLCVLPLVAMEYDQSWRALRSSLLSRARNAIQFGEQIGSAVPGAFLLTVAALLVAGQSGRVFSTQVIPNAFDPHFSPVRAVSHARAAGYDGRILNRMQWGGYIEYAWPEQKVFIDGETLFYGEALTRTYDRVVGLEPGWRAILDEYQIKAVLVPPTFKIAAALREERGWHVMFDDSTATLITRP